MNAESRSNWFCRSLGDGLLATGPLNEIEQAFTRLHPAAAPSDAAAFVRHHLDGLQCEVTVFLSPPLAELARQFGAHHCYPPDVHEVELLVGSAAALQQ